MKRSLAIPIAILLGFLSSVFAGDLARLGTTSGSQLLIPVGARSIALGGATLDNVKGAESIYWNPAGIAYSNQSEVLFNNMNWIGDIDVNYIALVFNGGNLGAFGFHIKSLDFGEIEETTEAMPDGTGDTFSPSFIVAGFSYSRLLTDHINVGVTGKLISERVMETGATGFAIDMGVQYRFSNNLRLGVVMKNVGSKMTYNGRNLERNFPIPGTSLQTDEGFFRGATSTSDIPSTFSFGASYTANINEENSLMFTGAFTNQNDASDLIFGGLEYGFKNLFYLRGGYNYEAQSSDDQVFGFAAGAGLEYPLGDFRFQLDYAFWQVTEFFDNMNVFTVKLSF